MVTLLNRRLISTSHLALAFYSNPSPQGTSSSPLPRFLFQLPHFSSTRAPPPASITRVPTFTCVNALSRLSTRGTQGWTKPRLGQRKEHRACDYSICFLPARAQPLFQVHVHFLFLERFPPTPPHVLTRLSSTCPSRLSLNSTFSEKPLLTSQTKGGPAVRRCQSP